MKNQLIIFALVLGTTFALSAQRGLDNNSNNGGNNSSVRGGQLGTNPNAGNTTTTDHHRGDSYGRGGETRPGSHGNGSGHNNGHNNNNNNNHNGHNGNGHNHNNNNHNGHAGHNNNHNHGNHNGHNHNNGYNNHNHNNGHNHGNNSYGFCHNHSGHNHHYQGYCSYRSHGYNWSVCNVNVFNIGCNTIRGYGFDSDRLMAAKNFVYNNYVSVHQICDMMQMLSFESNRLELAQYAFGRTVDVQNYHLVFNYLSFSSSKRELDNYINRFYF